MSTATAAPNTKTAAEDDKHFANQNAEHFNKVTQHEWPQWVHDLHAQITDFLASPECAIWLGVPSSSSSGRTRMLDYACGNGLLSKALKPRFVQCIGVDVSTGMLEQYKATAKSLHLGPDEMIGVRGDLTAAEPQPTDPLLPEDLLWDFDLVAISMALHHLQDPPTALARLAKRLRPGGTLLVIDWTPKDGSTQAQREYAERNPDLTEPEVMPQDHAAKHTISKPNWFTKTEMEQMFETCGCGEMGWQLAEELSDVPPAKGKWQMFFARATRL